MVEKIILPSILAANFYDLKSDIEAVKKAGATHLHLDVMDGNFVPNYSFGIPVIKSIRKNVDMILDGHLMIDKPGRYIENFAESGLDYITIHYEATDDVEKDLRKIREQGVKSGISISPKTKVEKLFPLIEKGIVNMVLIMSVEPGFGNQSFIKESLDKVFKLREFLDEKELDVLIEIDGGVSAANIKAIALSGVDMIVAGSAVFQGNIENNFKELSEKI